MKTVEVRPAWSRQQTPLFALPAFPALATFPLCRHRRVACQHNKECGDKFTRPRSMQCKSEYFARRRTGVSELSGISCHRDAASARRGSDPARVINLPNPVVATRHERMWPLTCKNVAGNYYGLEMRDR